MIFPKGSDLKGSAQPTDSKMARSDPKGNADNIRTSIIKTIKYSDHFDFPLTATEIYQRLISSKPYSSEILSKTLQKMVKNNQVENSKQYYYLPGKKTLIARRSKHLKSSIPQLLRARTLSKKLSSIPFIKAIYLTGSLAMNNSKADSDIDFMIITKEGRLWTTRFILTIYTSLLGQRRIPGSLENAGKLCLNLYLTPDAYLLPTHKQSLYTAYELIQAVPVYDPSDTHTALLAANPWISLHLANVELPARPGLAGNNYRPSRPGLIGQVLERLLFKLQYFYMKPKLTREYITINSAFFHPHDPSPQGL